MNYHPDPYVRNYQDRKMAKWLGFYLSEHTAEMSKEDAEREKIWPRKAAMEEAEVAKILEQAFNQQQKIILQLAELNLEGHPLPDIVATVEGIGEQGIYLLNETGELQVLPLAAMNHIAFETEKKWSQVE